jgi:ATP-dependent RNA helicase RhlE
MNFKELGIIEPILKALDAQGYSNPTPIQEKSIPTLLHNHDLLGCAQTGTGKTAAFAIPILQQLYSHPNFGKGPKKVRALVVSPTRELAIQIGDSFSAYGKYLGIRNTVIFGGVKQASQTNALKRGVDVLVATPGRLLDLMQQGYISLKDVRYFVLDEADQMLDMGFIHDIKKIIAKLPQKRQSLFFSATMAPAIVDLSKKILGNPEKVTIKPQQTTAEKVEQSLYFVSKQDKIKLLTHVLKEGNKGSTLVFSRTKHGADKIVKKLSKSGITSQAIHGNKSQNARQRTLSLFKDGKLNVLVATDIAARGIDVDKLAMVLNYDLPNLPETYVHRIGRTGRAEASGIAISFCDIEERPYLKDIEKLISQKITVINDNPYLDDRDESEYQAPPKKQNNRPRGNKGGGRGKGSQNKGGQNRGGQGRNRNRNKNRSKGSGNQKKKQ